MRQQQRRRKKKEASVFDPRHASRMPHYTSRWIFFSPRDSAGRSVKNPSFANRSHFQGQYHKRLYPRVARAIGDSRVTRKLTRFQLTTILSD